MSPAREYDQEQLNDALQLVADLSERLDVQREQLTEAQREIERLERRERGRMLKANFLASVAEDSESLGRTVDTAALWAEANERKRCDQLEYSAWTVALCLIGAAALGLAALLVYRFSH